MSATSQHTIPQMYPPKRMRRFGRGVSATKLNAFSTFRVSRVSRTFNFWDSQYFRLVDSSRSMWIACACFCSAILFVCIDACMAFLIPFTQQVCWNRVEAEYTIQNGNHPQGWSRQLRAPKLHTKTCLHGSVILRSALLVQVRLEAQHGDVRAPVDALICTLCRSSSTFAIGVRTRSIAIRPSKANSSVRSVLRGCPSVFELRQQLRKFSTNRKYRKWRFCNVTPRRRLAWH